MGGRKALRILPGLMFKSVEDAGRWHLKSVDGYNHMRNASRKRAGRPRMSKAEFRRRLMEDLKHEV